MTAIETAGLKKRFDGVTALDGLDLTVEEGEVYGFLGPNGAGKSTTINLLLGFVRPSDGVATVLGHDVQAKSTAVRQRTGALLEGFGFYPRATGLAHVRDAIRTKRTDDDPAALLDRVGLMDAADRRAGGYSTGMCKRLALAIALVGEPDLLVLDEPSTGLDPNGIRTLREVIRTESERGATVFFSSHILGQVEAVCDRIGILYRGELVADGSIAELREEIDADTVLRVTVESVPEDLPGRLRGLDGVAAVDATANRVDVTCSGGEPKYRVLSEIRNAGDYVDFTTEDPSLDDVFSQYTGGTT